MWTVAVSELSRLLPVASSASFAHGWEEEWRGAVPMAMGKAVIVIQRGCVLNEVLLPLLGRLALFL